MNKRRTSSIDSDLTGGNSSDADNTTAKKQKFCVPKIFYGKYFSIISNDEGKIEARCIECREVKKGHVTSTGNFKNHYRSRHMTLVSEMESYLKSKGDETTGSQTRQPTLAEFSSIVNPQQVHR